MNFDDDFDKIIKRQLEAFRRIFEEMQFSELSSEPQVEEQEGVRTMRWGPIVFGRTTTLGPDGRMHTQEWSNLPPEAREQLEHQMKDLPFSFMTPPSPQERRPSPIPNPLTPDRPFPTPQVKLKLKAEDYMIDILDTEDGYTAIFDTPATAQDDVKAQVEGRTLQLWVQGKIFRELELPVPVELTSLHFTNGVVELLLRSKKPEEKPNKASGEETEPMA